MGGYGSGRFRDFVKRQVEQCIHLDRPTLARAGMRRPGETAILEWDCPEAGRVAFRIESGWTGGGQVIRLDLYPQSPAGPRLDDTIYLESDLMPTGGLRWWLRCEGLTDHCGRYARRLYLPPGGECFRCRRCHDLVYRSSQESGGRRDRMLRRYADELGVSLREMRAIWCDVDE